MLNGVTPFITPDPPWLANLPLVVAIMAFLLAFGLSSIKGPRLLLATLEGQGSPSLTAVFMFRGMDVTA